MNNRTPRTRVRRGVLATSAIVIATALGVVGLTTGGASAGNRPDKPKPTIVLVHGGWADASGWNAQVADLQRRGYPVIAPANPLRGLESDAAYIDSILTTIEGPMLVGHSYGGAVISNAAVDVPNVKALVYIAGFAPDAGESLVQLVTMNPGSDIGPTTLIPRPYPLPGGGQGTDLYLTRTDSTTPSPVTCHARSPTRCRPHSEPSPRRPSRRSPVNRPRRRSPPGISSPPRTRRSRPRHSGSRPHAPEQPRSRSGRRTCR